MNQIKTCLKLVLKKEQYIIYLEAEGPRTRLSDLSRIHVGIWDAKIFDGLGFYWVNSTVDVVQ